MEWVSRVHAALSAGRFCLYAQDIVLLQPSNRIGRQGRPPYRALLRLVDEQGQLVPPMAFVPACERFNLMPMIDRWGRGNRVRERWREMHAEQPGEIGMLDQPVGASRWPTRTSPASVRQQAVRHDVAVRLSVPITEDRRRSTTERKRRPLSSSSAGKRAASSRSTTSAQACRRSP